MAIVSPKNKIVILLILVFLATSAFFMSNVVIPPGAQYVSAISVILFAGPAFRAANRWLGRRDAIILFVVLGILALAIETLAIITGFPYGHFGYSDLLGHRLFGITPWTVAFAWTPLVLAAYAVAARTMQNPAARVAAVALLLLVFDLVLDPGAVKMGFWRYEGGGSYYGVPGSNFLGWLFSGLIGATVLEIFIYLRKPLLPVPAQLISSCFFILSFWTAVALFSGLFWPVLIGIAVLILLAACYGKYHYFFDDMIVMVDENDQAIETALKLPAHNEDTKRHRAFSVFLFNDKGELLLQQRSLAKKTWPGVWSNSCCGHVMLHESVEKAARRRLKYELGIKVTELDLVLPHFRYRAEKDGVVENELCPVLVGVTSKQPNPRPNEVNDVKWMNWTKFVRDVKDPANGYSPWAIEEVELLEQDHRFRAFLDGQKMRMSN